MNISLFLNFWYKKQAFAIEYFNSLFLFSIMMPKIHHPEKNHFPQPKT